ncbi:unnamed protein product [Schistosoma margrebowiei]|uniref:Uncharacterized protein n=1 Tax=Schistosoma margrebowiei TaxID=48269 RepID=A0A183MXF0_9TREM|nr:unnamed protein product [Schistosoma margrebowiei]
MSGALTGFQTNGAHGLQYPAGTNGKLYLCKEFYHPHVDWITGEVSVHTEFPIWNPDKHHIWHILHYFKRLLTSPTSIIVSSLAEQTACIKNMRDVKYANPEAANALIHHPEEFDTRAKGCVTKLSVWTQPSQDIPSLKTVRDFEITESLRTLRVTLLGLVFNFHIVSPSFDLNYLWDVVVLPVFVD